MFVSCCFELSSKPPLRPELKRQFPYLTQIVAIASRSLERAEEFAKRHGIPKAYGGSYEVLAKDPNIGEA